MFYCIIFASVFISRVNIQYCLLLLRTRLDSSGVRRSQVKSAESDEVFFGLFNVCPGRRLRAVFNFVMKENVYRIDRITAKELSEFSGKSINSCKALLSKIGTKLTVNLTENLTEENNVTEEVKSGSVTENLTVKLPADSYQPEPVQKPRFDFNGFSQMTTEHDSSSSTAGDFFRKKNGSSIL